MKNKLYTWAFFILNIFLHASCMDDYMEATKRDSDNAYLSASEAQAFFENSFTMGHTRSVSEKKAFDPGEFTPQWKRALTSQNDVMGSVDIPLLSEYRYKAIRSEFKNGKSKAYVVSVTQKLVVLKNKHTEAKVQYLLTLIPDRDYYHNNKGDLSEKFMHAGKKGDYSGLAIYTHLVTGKIVSVSKYEEGNLIKNVFLPKGDGTLESRTKRVKELLGGIRAPRVKSLTTRSFGEGDFGIDCSFCGQDVNSCDCWSITDDCLCGYCDLCGWNCFWCGNDPCTCNDDAYCPDCGNLDCSCNGSWGCVYCGDVSCSGDCQDSSSCANCPGCAECSWFSDPDEQLGHETLYKIKNDLRSGNVKIQQVKMNGRDALLTAAGVGLNTNGLIISCTSFIENAGPLAAKLGNAVSGAGLIVGATQTYIGFSDGDITTADKLNAISTALSAAGLICVFIPGGQVVSGVLGVASCVVGIVSVFYTHNMPNEIHLKFDDGTSFHMCLIA